MTALAASVRAALDTVLDPELDEPVTQLGFVERCEVGAHGDVVVRLRLPTFFCAPNFSWLMVADAHDAVRGVAGVRHVDVSLADHHAAGEINAGVAAQEGFVGAFPGEAAQELDELRERFLAKAALAGQDRVARPLVDAGATPQRLAAMTLGEVPDSADLRRLRDRRAALGLPAGDDAPLLVRDDGTRVAADAVPLHLRRARLTRTGMEVNGEHCRALLASRYAGAVAAAPA